MEIKAGQLFFDDREESVDAKWTISEGSTIDVESSDGTIILRIQPEDFQGLAAALNQMIDIYEQRLAQRERKTHR